MIGEIVKWVLIIIGGLMGCTILYIMGWNYLAAIAPEAVEKYNLYFVIRDVKKYFGFLIAKGYTITRTHYSYQHFGNWAVTLESKECRIEIVQDRLELLLALAPCKADSRDGFSLGALIYFVTKGEVFIGFFEGNKSWGKRKQFERLAHLLEEYHDKITPYLDNSNPWESSFPKYKNELKATQEKYNAFLLADYRERRRQR
jgi:hypothetical protein